MFDVHRNYQSGFYFTIRTLSEASFTCMMTITIDIYLLLIVLDRTISIWLKVVLCLMVLTDLKKLSAMSYPLCTIDYFTQLNFFLNHINYPLSEDASSPDVWYWLSQSYLASSNDDGSSSEYLVCFNVHTDDLASF